MLSRFTKSNKPKWQHRDPDMRKVAVESLEDNATLSEIAQNDEAPPVRRAAVRKIYDLALLSQITQQEQDASVRELAEQRFRQLLCGQKENSPTLAERLAWLEKITQVDIVEYVSLNAREPQLRLIAVQKIQREGLLGDIAINDVQSDIRLVAAEKLTQKSTLERVAKAIRNRDKQVNRVVREKLDKITEQLERPARIRAESEAICKQIEALVRDAKTPSPITRLAEKWSLINTELDRLQARWQKIETEAETSFAARFTTARQQLTESYNYYQQEQTVLKEREQALLPLRTAKQALCAEVETLRSTLQARERLSTEETENFDQQLNALQMAWEDVQPLESIEEREWQNHFTKVYQAAKRHYQLLQDISQVAIALETLCQQMEAHLNEKIKAKHLKVYQEQWVTIFRSAKITPLIATLEKRYHIALHTLQKQLQAQTAQQEQDFNTLKRLLGEIEPKLESGELQAILPLEQEARELHQKLGELPTSRFKTLESRFQKITFRINELRSWARWGDDRERENLCLQMEALLDRVNDDPEETAHLIREAQKAWKKLDTTKHSQRLWERFNHACNEAYKPCKAYFEEKAQEREDNFLEKQALCEKLEALFQKTDWQNPDWKTVHHTVREIEKSWHKIGTTNRKAKKQVKKRFDDAIQALETHFAEERQRNRRQREQLIEKVKVTQTVENLSKAIETVKQLQAQWQITIPSSRREEHHLWKAFRTACDVVFDKRKEQRNEIKKEQQTHLNQKIAICEQIEALTQAELEVIKSIPHLLRKLQTDWHNIGNVPKRTVDTTEKRFTTACTQAMKWYRAFQLTEQRQQLDLLRQKAQLCTTLEQIVGGDSDVQIVACRDQWATLSTLADIKIEKAIKQRFEKACQIASGEQSPKVEEAIKARELLCIRLEIATGVASPPEAVEARLAYQVSRLSEAMSGGNVGATDKLAEIQEIERAWYLVEATSPEEMVNLQARFDNAYQVYQRLGIQENIIEIS